MSSKGDAAVGSRPPRSHAPDDSGASVYHLEVGRSFQRARVFNQERACVDRLLERWSRGETVVIGERQWDPAKSTLTVLEGRRLDASELALGQGWNSALRASRDVSAEIAAAAARDFAAADALHTPTPPSSSLLADDERLRAFELGVAFGVLAERQRQARGPIP